MSMEEDLKKLDVLTECHLSISINEHRLNYEGVEEALSENGWYDWYGFPHHTSEEVRRGMIERDRIVQVSAYTKTPVGCFNIYHYDLGEAIKEALEYASQELVSC